MVFAFVACDSSVKTPLGESGLLSLTDKENPLFGVIDETGNTVIPQEYNTVNYLKDDKLILAKNSTGEYLFDTKGKLVLSGKVLQKTGSLWKASYDDKTVVIWDKNNNLITDKYDNIIVGQNQLIVRKGELTGVLNRKGEVILPLEFENIEVMDDGTNHCYIAYDKKAKLYRRYDATGKKVKTVYYPKTYNNMKKNAVSTWSGGFKVKKI